MNWVDGVILLVIAANLLYGLIAGFIWQVAGICALVIGLAAGYILHGPVGMLLEKFIGNENLSRLAAFLIVFFTVSLLFRIIAALFKTFIKAIRLEKLDRLFGGVLGALKGIMISMIVVYAVVRYPVETYQQACRESFISRLFVQTADILVSNVPTRFSQRVNDFLREKRDAAGNTAAPEETPAHGLPKGSE